VFCGRLYSKCCVLLQEVVKGLTNEIHDNKMKNDSANEEVKVSLGLRDGGILPIGRKIFFVRIVDLHANAN
jgi:hypothetical protein